MTGAKNNNQIGYPKGKRLHCLAVLLALLIPVSGCVKTTRTIKIPAQVLQAKALDRERIIELLRERAAGMQAIQVSSLKAYFVGGDQESGKVEKYIGVPGYLLAERPDSLRITLQNPVTKSSLADIVSDGKEVKIWIPSKNRLYSGPAALPRIDDPRLAQNPLANLRPQHLVPAVLFGPFPEQLQQQAVLEEDTDGLAKYYIVSLIEKSGEGRLRLVRRVWMERSSLQVARERYYEEDGVLVAEIRYQNYRDFEGATLPGRIELQRPIEHYTIALELARIKLNLKLQPSAFQLARIPGAELVELGVGKR